MGLSIGVGLTNACNCNCPHCYSRGKNIEYLNVKKLFQFCELCDIDAVNFGTVESILHPDFLECISFFSNKNIPISLTSNGYTIDKLTDDQLVQFNDIDLSIDFPFEEFQDSFRQNGQFNLALRSIERCKKLNIECSVACCLMNTNYKYITEMINFCRSLEVNLRINIYKPVHTDEFTLTYNQFWESIKILMENSELISCSEPIVCLALTNNDGKESYRAPCGHNSLRIKPSGYVVPCVYILNDNLSLDDLIYNVSQNISLQQIYLNYFGNCFCLPKECDKCKYKQICGGGCNSRRLLTEKSLPDMYCFVKNNEYKSLTANWTKQTPELVHSNYLCTLIVK